MGKAIIASAVVLALAVVPMQDTYSLASIKTGSGAPSAGLCTTQRVGNLYVDISNGRLYSCDTNGTWVGQKLSSESGGGGALESGSIIFVSSGSCPSGTTEADDLTGRTIVLTTNGAGNVGGTGGADTITPEGTNSAATFTGSAWTPPAVSWPAGVPTFSGSSLGNHQHTYTDVVNHTHTISVTDPGHTHTENGPSAANGGLVGWTPDASTNTSTASGYSTASATTGITASSANPGGGVATGTTANASAGTPAGTVAWPAGVPTIAAYTPAGTNGAATFTGTSFDNRSAFVRLIACRAN